MDVESSNKQIRKEACYSDISIAGRVDCVLSEVFNSLGSFCPNLSDSMTAEENPVKCKSKDGIEEDM
jgi:hypothetical protein